MRLTPGVSANAVQLAQPGVAASGFGRQHLVSGTTPLHNHNLFVHDLPLQQILNEICVRLPKLCKNLCEVM